MFLSKIWVCLLAVAAALCLGLALVVPRPAARELARSYAENLDRGQHNADLMLRLEARDWIDAVAKMAWDNTLVDVLEQASNRKGDLAQHQARAAGRLLSLVGRLESELRPQLLIAVGYRGKQIARLGPGEDKVVPGETGLAGYPLVEAALRGYRSDDTWNLDGRLYLVAASPVISRSKGRYVGAIVLGHELNETFARRLKARLNGTEVAFFLRGKMVASTVRNAELSTLPRLFTKRRAQIVRDGRSAALRVGDGASAQNVILAALPGEAAEHDAFYAAIGAPAPSIGLGEMLSLVRKSDLTWNEFPWLLLGGALLAALVVGFVLSLWESDLPGRRLLGALHKLARREATKLEDRLYPGRYGSIARAVNEALEKTQQPQKRPSIGRESGKLPALGPGRLERDLRQGGAGGGGMEPLGGGIVGMEPLGGGIVGVEPLGGGGGMEPLGGGGGMEPLGGGIVGVAPLGVLPSVDERDGGELDDALALPALDAEDAATEIQPERSVFDHEPRFTSLESISAESISAELMPTSIPVSATLSAAGSEPPPAPAAPSGPAFDLEPLLMPEAPEEPLSGPPPRKVRIPASEERTLPPRPLGDKPVVLPELALMPLPGPPPAAPPQPALPPRAGPGPLGEAADAEAEYFHQVFKDFLAIKRQCGENVSNLTYERFVEKLRKNRDTLLENYGCKSVKFQVYIKDGKAALKATPVKD